VKFYRTTHAVWSSGKLSWFDKSLEDVRNLSYENFVTELTATEGESLCMFFTQFAPLEGEFLVDTGTNEECGVWFVLTNLRLIQKNGRDSLFKAVSLTDLAAYKSDGTWEKTLTIQMKSGSSLSFEKVLMAPEEAVLLGLVQHGCIPNDDCKIAQTNGKTTCNNERTVK